MSRIDKAILGLLGAHDYHLTVVGAQEVTDHFRLVEFAAPEMLAAHETPPTFWIRLWVPTADGDEVQRGFTVTNARPAEGRFTVGFALHEPAGPASAWGKAAAPGQRVRATVYGAKAFPIPDPALAGYLFFGDAASLVAIGDALRALPEEIPARVVMERHHDDDLLVPLPVRDGDSLEWLEPREDADVLAEAVAKLEGPLEDWAALVVTESGSFRKVKGALRRRGMAKDRISGRAYWIRGKAMGVAGAPLGE